MPSSSVKLEDGTMSCETPEGTVINIHINQRSVLDSLFDGIRSLRKRGLRQAGETSVGAQRSLGSSQITLGLICVMFAIILCFGPDQQIFETGALFWTGFPLIVSGALSVAADKRPSFALILFSVLSHLVSLAVCVAGLVILSNDLSRWPWFWRYGDICDRRNDYNGWESQDREAPTMGTDYRQEECQRVYKQFLNLLLGLLIVILFLIVWALCISVYSLGFRLRNLCCGFYEEEILREKDQSLLNSPGYKNIEINE